MPHIQITGATYFITFRLANSLPIEALDKPAEETRKIKALPENQRETAQGLWFAKFDDYPDQALHGEVHLKNEQITNMVVESIHFRDEKIYDLISYCIMPNHGHLVCAPLLKEKDVFFGLAEILHSLKRHTARQANIILQRSGAFWQDESYDHFIRDDEELERIVKYVLYSPLKANLTEGWTKWKWTYCKYDF